MTSSRAVDAAGAEGAPWQPLASALALHKAAKSVAKAAVRKAAAEKKLAASAAKSPSIEEVVAKEVDNELGAIAFATIAALPLAYALETKQPALCALAAGVATVPWFLVTGLPTFALSSYLAKGVGWVGKLKQMVRDVRSDLRAGAQQVVPRL